MSGCYCGEFDRPTIAPDEFGETCFHERDKCEVPPVPVPIETVLRLTRARAEQAEAAIARVLELPASQIVGADGHVRDMLLRADVLNALDGDSEDALVQGAITAMLSEDAPLIDPDCRDGKHSSCVGGPCQCPCHELAAS